VANSKDPPARNGLSGVSRRGKKKYSKLRWWIQELHLHGNRFLKKILTPMYRRLGITSVARWFIPGYRRVTKSIGGEFFRGSFLGPVASNPVIAVVGDYGSGKIESNQVAQMIEREPAHAVVTLGDNVYYETGYQTLVGNFYGEYLQAGAFFPATGNHDYTEGRGIALFDRYFDFLQGNRWYSVTFGEVEFFVLDSEQALHHSDVHDAQRSWLQSATKQSDATWKIVVVHHPPHSARSRSQEEFRFPYAEWGVCMVMSGHDHTLQHLWFDDVHYVVNGIGGGSLHEFEEILEGTEFRLSTEYGAVFLDILPDRLHVRFMTLPRTEVYSFDIPAPQVSK
jgi:hypothetical protein